MPQVFDVFLCKIKHLFGYENILVVLLVIIAIQCHRHHHHRHHDVNQQTARALTTKICVQLDRHALRVRHKSCLLRPDTGPCRADIIQYYFDASLGTCYRFFWGGCQGNGNRFEDRSSCMKYCHLNSTETGSRIPYFCNLAFDFGTCFGHYNRWYWDKISRTCKRRLYSGCGGNQNNFESLKECISTCLTPPNNTVLKLKKYTTCIPFTIDDNH